MRYVLIALGFLALMLTVMSMFLGTVLGWGTLGKVLLSILWVGGGLLVGAFALWIVWRFRQTILPPTAFRLGKLFWTNNGWAWILLVTFSAFALFDLYQFGRVVQSYLDRPAIEPVTYSEPALKRSAIERSVYQYLDGNQDNGRELTKQVPVPTAKPRDLKPVGWFVWQTIKVFFLGLATLIYFPWSRHDELMAWIRRKLWKLNHSSGGTIEEHKPRLIREYLERLLGPKPIPAEIVGTGVAGAATVAVAPVASEKSSIFGRAGKWFHNILTTILLLDEVKEQFDKHSKKARVA